MDKSEIIQRGQRAALLLDDDLIKGAFADVEAAIVGQWRELSVENKGQAEELKRLLWAANQFKAIFESLICGASVAKNELLMDSNMQIKAEAARERVRNYG